MAATLLTINGNKRGFNYKVVGIIEAVPNNPREWNYGNKVSLLLQPLDGLIRGQRGRKIGPQSHSTLAMVLRVTTIE